MTSRDDVEFLAKRFVKIGEQIKRKLLFHLELLVRGKAVPGHAKNYRVLAFEFRIEIANILPCSSAARRAVLGVKVDNDFFAPQ